MASLGLLARLVLLLGVLAAAASGAFLCITTTRFVGSGCQGPADGSTYSTCFPEPGVILILGADDSRFQSLECGTECVIQLGQHGPGSILLQRDSDTTLVSLKTSPGPFFLTSYGDVPTSPFFQTTIPIVEGCNNLNEAQSNVHDSVLVSFGSGGGSPAVSCVDLDPSVDCDRPHEDMTGACLEVVTSSGVFRATGDHLIHTPRDGWRLVRELRAGDLLRSGLVESVKETLCRRLNSCQTDSRRFDAYGEVFAQNALITPDNYQDMLL